jgi:uncharacterized protein (DUF1330 family)
MVAEIRFQPGPELDAYRAAAGKSFEKFGGTFLIRGAAKQFSEAAENQFPNVVIVAFPSLEQAKAWYASPEYTEALKVREKAMTRNLFFVADADG